MVLQEATDGTTVFRFIGKNEGYTVGIHGVVSDDAGGPHLGKIERAVEVGQIDHLHQGQVGIEILLDNSCEFIKSAQHGGLFELAAERSYDLLLASDPAPVSLFVHSKTSVTHRLLPVQDLRAFL